MFEKIKTIFSGNNKTKEEKNIEKLEQYSPLPAEKEAEAPEVTFLNTGLGLLSFEENTTNIKKLVTTYRRIAKHPEVEPAIDEICDSAIVEDENNNIIEINITNEKINKSLKEKIIDSFYNILSVSKFNENAYDYFRRWYEDGRLYFEIIFDPNNTKKGILKLRRLDPLQLTRVKEKETGKKYFIYKVENRAYKIPEENIIFIDSGITDEKKEIYISNLHKVIKPLNQLDSLESSAIIYRFTRAPERRVFYIGVGKMPPQKAEAYVNNLMRKFNNKISFDPATGLVSSKKNTMNMVEDFWIPRMESGTSTEIETLPSGQNLGEIEDILYFRKRLLRALKVPPSRLDMDDSPSISFDRMGELTREELKFAKFINRLRKKFISGFIKAWKYDLIMKNIIDEEFWFENIDPYIKLIWNEDSYFNEMKDQELLKSRIELLGEIENYIGTYFSKGYAFKEILKLSEDEIEQMKKEIEEEKKNGEIDTEENSRY